MAQTRRDRGSERGFALILAILSLMLLTFLGLTLATTTSTELKIATNYRWSIQARYNAEAGIEAGKKVLQSLNWTQILPVARGTYTAPTALPFTGHPPSNPPTGLASSTRNFAMGDCDTQGDGVGFGVVLFDGTNTYQDVTIVPGLSSPPALNGAFTLWVRRPVTNTGGLNYQDSTADDTMVLTAEGVAPYTGAQFASALSRSNLARQVIEVSLTRQGAGTPCGGRGGQIGGGPEGNNIYGATGCDKPNFDEAVRHTGATFENGGTLNKQ